MDQLVAAAQADPLHWAPSWRERGIAVLRLLLMFVLIVAISFGLYFGMKLSGMHLGAKSLSALFFGEAATAAMPVIAALIVWAIFREPLARFGIGGVTPAKLLGTGAGAGIVAIAFILILMALAGGYDFGAIEPSPVRAIGYGLLYVAFFTLVAIAEEGLFRGYMFVQLCRAMSFWPAALLSSVLFALVHVSNAGETPAGIASVFLFGMLACWAFKRTGGLWLAAGIHGGWDYAQSYIFGVPDSGLVLPGALLHPRVHGPAWLTGGTPGPEGSWLAIVALVLLAVMVWFLPRRSIAATPVTD